MRTLVGELAAFCSGARPPPEVRESVGRRLLDTLGVAVGAAPLDTSAAIRDFALGQGGAPQAHAIGCPVRLPAPNAALVNGTHAHSLDYDDTHLPSIVHPSAPVIPACLAAAELHGAGGPDLVRAIAVALEVCVRLGMAGYDREARTSIFFERGQHATAMCGAIAGAAGAAVLAGLDESRVAHAMAVATSMASGIFEANRTGGTVKRLHCGWAAHAAVTAAELSARGFTGAPTALEGRFGFFRAFVGDRYDATAVTDRLGDRWSVPDICFKPYPANHFTHTTIDALLELRRRGLSAGDVESVTVGIAGPTIRSVGEPIEIKRAPQTGYHAQFSIPYVVAAALTGGGGLGLGLDDFTDDLARDPGRRDLASRVSVEEDASCTSIYPEQLPAVVTVRTKDGATLEQRRMTNRGGAHDPLTDDDLRVKFRDAASRGAGAEAVAAIEDAVRRIDRLSDVGELLRAVGEQRG